MTLLYILNETDVLLVGRRRKKKDDDKQLYNRKFLSFYFSAETIGWLLL